MPPEAIWLRETGQAPSEAYSTNTHDSTHTKTSKLLLYLFLLSGVILQMALHYYIIISCSLYTIPCTCRNHDIALHCVSPTGHPQVAQKADHSHACGMWTWKDAAIEWSQVGCLRSRLNCQIRSTAPGGAPHTHTFDLVDLLYGTSRLCGASRK